MRKTMTAFAIAIALAFGCASATFAVGQKDEKKKGEKSEKSEKSDKTEKDEKTEKSEKSEKSAKSEKSDKKSDKKDAKTKSLYSRLGGKKAIRAVVEQFVANVASDSRINKYFADAANDPKRLEKLKSNLSDQICKETGGPCKYKGKDMVTAHKGMSITDADFDALVEDLVAALNKLSVPEAEQKELLTALASMKGQIVGQ